MSQGHSSYPVTIHWTIDRQGLLSAPDGPPSLPVAAPPQFGGPGARWTPEHLFAAAMISCWMTAFRTLSAIEQLTPVAFEADSVAYVEKGEDRRFWIPRMTLRPRITVARESDREVANRLATKAQQVSLVARSMRTQVDIEVTIVVLDVAADTLASTRIADHAAAPRVNPALFGLGCRSASPEWAVESR